MKKNHATRSTRVDGSHLAVRASVIAVRCALMALALITTAAYAEETDPAVADLVTPPKKVEFGIGNVSSDNAKANEYNGVRQKGGFAVGNIDLHGGGAYDSNDASRWSVIGTNLGLDSRDLAADYRVQGSFSIYFDYSELLRNRSSTYQTPYLGAGVEYADLACQLDCSVVSQNSATNATSVSTSPSARGLSPVTGLNAPGAYYPVAVPTPKSLATLGAAANSTMNSILSNDVPDFHSQHLGTERDKYKVGFTYNVDSRWSVSTSAIQEHRFGLQPLSTISAQSGGDIATVIPNVIDQNTNQFNAAVNYVKDHNFFTAAYYGSVFRDNVTSMSWQNWAIPGAGLNTMSTAPDNQFHQLTLTGGGDITNTTKLVGDLSYGRSTQSQPFGSQISSFEMAQGLPASVANGANSANALVINKAASLKLTSRPVKDLALTAGYKYDARNNHTPVNTYAFYDVGGTASGNSIFNAPLGLAANTLGTNVNIEANRPYSKTVNS